MYAAFIIKTVIFFCTCSGWRKFMDTSHSTCECPSCRQSKIACSNWRQHARDEGRCSRGTCSAWGTSSYLGAFFSTRQKWGEWTSVYWWARPRWSIASQWPSSFGGEFGHSAGAWFSREREFRSSRPRLHPPAATRFRWRLPPIFAGTQCRPRDRAVGGVDTRPAECGRSAARPRTRPISLVRRSEVFSASAAGQKHPTQRQGTAAGKHSTRSIIIISVINNLLTWLTLGQRRTSSTCRSGQGTFLQPLFYSPIPYQCVALA